jgi:hypothetical protein
VVKGQSALVKVPAAGMGVGVEVGTTGCWLQEVSRRLTDINRKVKRFTVDINFLL